MTVILCIEDDVLQRQEIVDTLKTEGFDVFEASDGDSGLEIILSKQLDLILCDRMMAGKSGYTLLEEIRENHPEKMGTPFVFLTALDDRRDKLATAGLHPAAYITKPIDLGVLIDEIKRLTQVK
jgi:DNA-binding response OmpR family regulator